VSGLELVGVGAWSFAVALAGGVVGLVLGTVRLPLFGLAASSPASAGGANIAVSGIAAATASTTHIRAGRINWSLFAWMAPPSIAAAVAGGYLAGTVPDSALLFVISAVLLYSGLDLLLRRPQPVVARRGRRIVSAVVSGAVIGLLGGFVGLILGSLRMPALLRIVGEPATRAVGTNLAVGVCVGVAGLLGHLPSAAPDYRLVLVGGAASIPGALLGARLTGRLSEERIVQAIGAILLVAALATALQAIF
jgi:uncharacterized membrane protein YfcA